MDCISHFLYEFGFFGKCFLLLVLLFVFLISIAFSFFFLLSFFEFLLLLLDYLLFFLFLSLDCLLLIIENHGDLKLPPDFLILRLFLLVSLQD